MPPSRDASDGCTGAQPSEFVAIGGGAVCTSSVASQHIKHIKHENSQQRSMTSNSCPIAPGCVAAGVGRADAARGRKLFLRSLVRLALLLPDESGGLLAAALLPVVAM